MNRYYIIDSNDKNLDKILSYCVESRDTLRYSLDLTKCVVKLKSDDTLNHFELLKYTPYNHEEILQIMYTSEWSEEIE